MKTLTEEQRTRLEGYSEKSKILALKTWRSNDYDVSEYQHLLSEPSLPRKAVNFVKAVTKHVRTGRKTVPPEVQAERQAKCDACPYFGLQSKGVCGHKECGCVLKVKTEWATSVCPDGQWGVFVPESLVPGGDHVVESASGVLVTDGGGVESVVGRAESLGEQGNADTEAQPNGNAENVVDDGIEKSHARGPVDGSGPIHNVTLSVSDHRNFDNPKEKLMSPSPPETASPAGPPLPVSPGAAFTEVLR